jgi:hypothetical protein
VAGLARSGRGQRLGDGESGTPVGQPDLDHRARLLGQEKVAQDIAIGSRHRNARKVTAGADPGRAVGRQLAARLPDPAQEFWRAPQLPRAAHDPGRRLFR